MAITLTSDIVLDVAKAVEPAGVEAARAALAKRSGRAHGTFAVADVTQAAGTRTDGSATTPEAFNRFEAMVLKTFIQNMLPADGAAVYGKGVAGDMWKSMLAEKIADVMAERGGIGIAERVLGDHYVSGKDKLPVGAVSGAAERAEADRQSLLSTALVQEIQRKLALADGTSAAEANT